MAYMDWVFLLGRILYGGFFVLGGINHFLHLNMMAGFAASKGAPAAKASVVFTFPMYNYWIETDMMARINQRVNVQKNLAPLGAALMMLMLPRPWPMNLLGMF